MTNLERRLRKLEAALTDRNGLVPHTKPWLEYWTSKYELIASGQEDAAPGSFPLEAYRAVVMEYERNATEADGLHIG